MSKKRSVWKNLANGKTVRRNQGPPPDQQWSWWTIAMLESPAYRALGESANKVIARIRIEFGHHGGQDNGELPVTYRNFVEYGVHWNSIHPAICEAEALGWIRITEYGLACPGEFGRPTKFALTHYSVGDAAPTNDWSRIGTLEEAEAIVKTARQQPAQHCRLPRRKGPVRKTNSNTESVLATNTESVSLGANTESVSLSIFRGGGRGCEGGGSTLDQQDSLTAESSAVRVGGR